MIEIDKIAIVGGGSTYTPEFVDGFIQRREQLQVGEIALFDINAQRLELVGGMVRRMVEHAGLSTAIRTYTDRPAAVFGGKVTLHIGPDRRASVLLPVIP